MSNYLETEIAKHLFLEGSFVKPTALYIALMTSAPGEEGGGVEVSNGGYARVMREPTSDNWEVSAAGVVSNKVAVTYPYPTANWGSITHVAIFDAPTGGNMLFSGALTYATVAEAGDPAPTFPAGSFQITIDA